jgi:hypothetical protein
MSAAQLKCGGISSPLVVPPIIMVSEMDDLFAYDPGRGLFQLQKIKLWMPPLFLFHPN